MQPMPATYDDLPTPAEAIAYQLQNNDGRCRVRLVLTNGQRLNVRVRGCKSGWLIGEVLLANETRQIEYISLSHVIRCRIEEDG